nr:immunoglobulin heavy chain junction region [Mus musculus]
CARRIGPTVVATDWYFDVW